MDVELLDVFAGILTTVAVCGIPWAYKLNSRLVSIETKIEMGLGDPELTIKMAELATELVALRKEVKELELCMQEHKGQ